MESDVNQLLKEIEAIIESAPPQQVDEWLILYREYERKEKNPLTIFEWILRQRKNA